MCFSDEFGSYDPQLSAFIPMKFLGSTNSSLCVTGFDQLSFMEGVSASLFDAFNTSVGHSLTRATKKR